MCVCVCVCFGASRFSPVLWADSKQIVLYEWSPVDFHGVIARYLTRGDARILEALMEIVMTPESLKD